MRIITLLFSIVLISACSNSSTPEVSNTAKNIYANYYVRYLESERMLKAEATFYKGDNPESAQPLTLQKGLSLFGNNMSVRRIQNKISRYHYENLMDYPKDASFPFKYNHADSEAQTYTMSMSPVGKFEIKDCSISKGINLELETALNSNESFVVLFNDANNRSVSLMVPFTENKSINIPLGAYKEILSKGKSELYLVKKQKKEIEKDGNIENKGLIEYYSKSVEVELTE